MSQKNQDIGEEIKTNIFYKPYYVITDDQEEFYVVKSITESMSEEPFKYDKHFDYSPDKLIIGDDILEVPVRMSGIVSPFTYTPGVTIIKECQEFARLCLCDYVGIDGSYKSFLNQEYVLIKPRLFRKILDN